MQIPDNLIQTRRKRRIHIQEDTIRLLAPEPLPQIPHHHLKLGARVDLAQLLLQGRRRAHGLEAHADFAVLARVCGGCGGCERGGGVARQVGEHDGGGHGEREVWGGGARGGVLVVDVGDGGG